MSITQNESTLHILGIPEDQELIIPDPINIPLVSPSDKDVNITDGQAIIQLTGEAILHNDNDKLVRFLNISPLDKLTSDQADVLLNRYLETAAGIDNTEAIPIILDAWKRVYPEEEDTPLPILLFMIPLFNSSTLSFVIKSMKDISYMEMMDYFIRYDSKPELSAACKKAVEVFGEQDVDTYNALLGFAENRKNKVVIDFLLNKIRENNNYAELGPWIKHFNSSELNISDPTVLSEEVPLPRAIDLINQIKDLAKVPPISFNLPPDTELINIFTEGFETSGVTLENLEEIRNTISFNLSNVTREEKLALFRPIIEMNKLKNLETNVEIFRIFGPVHPLIDSDIEEMTWGGSRMFISTIYDFNHEMGYMEDYFDFYCYVCNFKLISRWHCLRKPRPLGGWEGCYCSFNCMRKSEERNENPEDQNPDIATMVLMDIFERQIMEIGIANRIDDLKFEDLLEIEQGNV